MFCLCLRRSASRPPFMSSPKLHKPQPGSDSKRCTSRCFPSLLLKPPERIISVATTARSGTLPVTPEEAAARNHRPLLSSWPATTSAPRLVEDIMAELSIHCAKGQPFTEEHEKCLKSTFAHLSSSFPSFGQVFDRVAAIVSELRQSHEDMQREHQAALVQQRHAVQQERDNFHRGKVAPSTGRKATATRRGGPAEGGACRPQKGGQRSRRR